MSAAVVPSSAGAPAAAPQQPPPQQGPNDQVDGDLVQWVKQLDAMVPSGSHHAFTRAWGGVGQHEAFGRMSADLARTREQLQRAAKLNDEVAAELKEQGNKAYAARKFNMAVAMYSRAMMYVAWVGP